MTSATVEGWALPGLVDAHCHVGLGRARAGGRRTSRRSRRSPTARPAPCCSGTPARPPTPAGSTTARTCPKIIRAGRHIARTRRYIRNYAHEIEPEDLVAYVAQEARRGDGWVKLVGDWIDRERRRPGRPAGRAAAVEAAIAEAHRLGARVTAHCFAEDSLRDLVEAGIDCVEHATGSDRGHRSRCSPSAGVAIVPTLVNIATFPKLADGGEAKFPRWSAHMRRLHERRYDTVRAAYDAGIPVFVGTDAGGTLPHGLVAAEVAELVTAGHPPAGGALGDDLGRPRLAGPPRPGRGRAGRPRGVRHAIRATDVRVLAAPPRVVLNGRVVG